MSIKSRLLVILIAGIALILCLLALQLIFPGETSLHATSGAASISFSAERRLLVAPGSCVTVHWQVDHIQAVFINGLATVGEGQKNICVNETTMPVLSITFMDGTKQDYPLTIEFLTEQPSTWLLVSAAILLGLAGLLTAASRPGAAAAQEASRRTPRLLLVFAAIGVLATGLALTGVILEAALRFYFVRFGTEYERTAFVDSRAEIEARQSDLVTLPFVEFGLSPDYPGQTALGYRGDDIQVPKPPGVYRIVVLGDSSTYGTFVPYDQTFPYQLQTVLHGDYSNKQIEVVNGGVPGYTSWNIFVDLALRVTELQPDLVIVYEGGNDVLPREVPPDCYNGATPFLGLDPRRLLRAQPGDLSPFTLYRFVAANLGWTPSEDQLNRGVIYSRIGCSTPNVANNTAYVAANPPVYFERNLRDMIGVAKANGITLMFASWAYNPNSADVLDYWRAAVAQHNAITARVAQENGALYLDYASLAPTDSHSWNDYMHLTAEGNLGQAQAFAKFLLEHGVISGAGS